MTIGRSDYDIVLVGIDQVRPTEESDTELVEELLNEVSLTGVWTRPILVDDRSFAVMDGHARLAAAQRLGLRVIPAVLLSYDDPRVRLDSRRGGRVDAAEIRDRATTGRLFPRRTVRHVVEPQPPEIRVALERLYRDAERGALIDPTEPPNSRVATLIPLYHRLGASIGIQTTAATRVGTETAETQAPHPLLRQLLQIEPAMGALLPAAATRIALGTSGHAPFYLRASGLVMLPPVLLGDSAALCAAARWALETSCLVSVDRTEAAQLGGALVAALRHGAALIEQLEARQRDLVLDHVPDQVARALRQGAVLEATPDLLAWQASRVESLDPWTATSHTTLPLELSLPVERLMVSGGDSRIRVDPVTGYNRYGTVPRPRPEAVQFSSSTASSVSDYGFMLCDMLRRDLLGAALRDGRSTLDLRGATVDALAAELTSLLGLDEAAADVTLAPSGTDTELLAVGLALAADDRPLTNILIAPEESGRGVALAGEGRFFDDVTASGASVGKGESAWPDRLVQVRTVAIRGEGGEARAPTDIDADLEAVAGRALGEGHRLLVHVLAASKTGLRAPSLEAVARIRRSAPERVDVVVDACQMRNPLHEIGGWVLREWMVQISGSKFLTGPPFSAALVIPRVLRLRARALGELLRQAPGVGTPEDWNSWWRASLAPAAVRHVSSFGPLFRALPAIAEAHLLNALTDELCSYAFYRFQEAVEARLATSVSLVPIATQEPADSRDDRRASDGLGASLFSQSIVSFSVTVPDTDGTRRTLGADECQRLFELLNTDVCDRLHALTPADQVKAAQRAHLGQPVSLAAGPGLAPLTVLRLVVGARFFTIVGHAGPGAVEAALESEISDAVRAIEKVELLAERWSELAGDRSD
jgi:hypothetical protein